MNQEKINQAIAVLHAAGYHVGCLWNVKDVTERYQCDHDTAYEILSEVLDANIDTIFDSIHCQAKYEHKLEEVES